MTSSTYVTPFVNLFMSHDFVPIRSSYDDPDVTLQFINDVFIRGKKGIIVFHSPDCGFCKKLMKTLEDFSKKVSKDFAIGLIDISDETYGNNVLSDYFAIEGTPTIYTFNEGALRFEGSGAQYTVDDLMSIFHVLRNENNVYIRGRG